MQHSSLRKTILILAANPTDTARLRLDEEIREIDNGLRMAKRRDQFNLAQRWAVRSEDMRRALLEVEPQIVHFCGHGYGNDGLAVENDSGKMQLVPTKALGNFFMLFKEHVECVVLNACYSEAQAVAISQHIPYVIGMSQAIGDRAAIEFAVGFYDALGAGRSYEDAYAFGCNAIALRGIRDDLIPAIKYKSSVSTSLQRPPLKPTPGSDQKTLYVNKGSAQPSRINQAPIPWNISSLRSAPSQTDLNSLASFPAQNVNVLRKVWPFLGLIMLTWLIVGIISRPDPWGEWDLPALMIPGLMGGLLSGLFEGLARRRICSSTPWDKIFQMCFVSGLVGLLAWSIVGRLSTDYKTIAGLFSGIAINLYILLSFSNRG